MENENMHAGLFGEQVEITIENAKNGDTESARKILSWFCGAIKANTDKNGKPHRKPSGTGTQIDERILRYIGECFEKILDDWPGARNDVSHALGIVEKGKIGRKETKAIQNRDLDMGYEVSERHDEIKASKKKSKIPRSRGVTPLDEAIQDVAEKYNKSNDTVRNAYKKWKALLKQCRREYSLNM